MTPHTQEVVLLADDELIVRTVVHKILERCGYVVLDAATGEEALAELRSHAGAIDLLLTDVNMPGMQGTELANLAHSEWPRMSLLLMSGYLSEPMEDTNHALHFINKPFQPAALVGMIRRILHSKGQPAAEVDEPADETPSFFSAAHSS